MDQSFVAENIELMSGGGSSGIRSVIKEMDTYTYGIMILVFAVVYYLVVYSDLFRGFRESIRGFLKRLLLGSYVSNGEISTTKHVTWKDNVVQYVLGDSDDSDSDDSDDSDDYVYESTDL
jgi:hypothetical protein